MSGEEESGYAKRLVLFDSRRLGFWVADKTSARIVLSRCASRGEFDGRDLYN